MSTGIGSEHRNTGIIWGVRKRILGILRILMFRILVYWIHGILVSRVVRILRLHVSRVVRIHRIHMSRGIRILRIPWLVLVDLTLETGIILETGGKHQRTVGSFASRFFWQVNIFPNIASI